MATKKQSGLRSTGKRKRAIARVSLKEGTGKVTINGKELKAYLGARISYEKKLNAPFEITGTIGAYDVVVNVQGGGIAGQAEAIMYGIAKALASKTATNRNSLKAAGLLTRDSRIKEMKKYGQKKARKKFQFSKR